MTGKKAGRQRAEERTMTANLGLAIDDMAVAPLILFQRALKKESEGNCPVRFCV